jgi:hypothetical protein
MTVANARPTLARLALVALTTLSSGCYRASLSSGLPPGDAAPDYDFRWKHAFLFGTADNDEDLDLFVVCPHGWAEIDEQHDILTATTTLGTLGIYTPRRVTIVCVARTKSLRPAQNGYDLPLTLDDAYPARSLGDPPPPPPPRSP